ncbi:Putative monocarboxylate permeases [Komagataella phaffii CBS 7435]|uniref:Protein with similarity to mammalian monocarboxylate permease n=2 Tax=Komagataella phaffii TaxID=460519 RepID=C4QXI7_KOMPG|nr:Protein with similarity to mammalian monocarboxylate permease [Komagataella phaffii GS115]AOA61814.1 GQ67_02055T0 [Komagataella phaffii]CAH2446774.1 Putative monocarboxylate permeases [Komagataella phaffii CBS 7435]AOA65594.1 GQ68_02070T0 [Komagataella phaffii GS115]CAY67960.1 Protein with similarity to mammalian monocarboxylate permease [Komagataella phaffii GS115]CCA37034.1 Putative monocarboxylate permeases [Komagataella phaffii CBS 7435]
MSLATAKKFLGLKNGKQMSDSTPMKSKELEVVNVESVSKDNPHQVPDGGYGWFVVIGCFLFNLSTWGANSGYAIYLAHYLADDTFHGASKIDYAIIGGLSFASGTVLAPLINYLVGVTNLTFVLVLGWIIQFIAVMLASWATKLWQLFLTQGVLFGIGMALVALSNVNVLPQWFKRKRNLAGGIAAAGSGGGVIFNVGMQDVMNKHGYQWALRAQAIICASLSFVGICLVRSRNKHIKPVYRVSDKQVWSCFGTYMLILWTMTTMLGYVTLMYNLADFTRSLGYSASQGSVVSAMVAVGACAFRPLTGLVGDRLGPVSATILIHTFVFTLVFAMWIPTRNYATAVAFALMVGATMGTVWVVMAGIATRVFGLKKVGVGLAALWIAIGVSGFCSPIIGISLKSDPPNGAETDPTQYVNPAIFVGFMYFASVLSLIILRAWLITRDEISVEVHGGHFEDSADDLLLRVPPLQCIRNICRFRLPRKV